MVNGEAVEGEQVFLGLFEQCGSLRQRRVQSLERVADELAGQLARVGIEDRPQQGGHHPLLILADVAEKVREAQDDLTGLDTDLKRSLDAFAAARKHLQTVAPMRRAA